MPSFSKLKKRILKRGSEVSNTPVPANRDPDPALRDATVTSTTVIAEIPTATLMAARLVVPEIPSVLQPPNDKTLSFHPSIVMSSSNDLSGDNNDLWARAYVLAKEREKQLMEDYERHIASLGSPVDGKSSSAPAPHNVEGHVKQLLEIRQRKKIQVSILGHDTTMRKQVQKLAKFLLWSDSIVRSAVNTQPYAALAWSGVSLFLPLLVCGAKYNEGMLDGFGSISDLQIFWKSYEDTYFGLPKTKLYQNLKDLLVKLYSFMIEYQARVICHLSKAQLSRAWQNMAGSDDWDIAIKRIRELHDECLCLVDRAHKDVIQTKMDSQLQEIQQSRMIEEETLQVIKEDRKDEKERKLLKDLAMTSGDYERYKNINPERVPGTCMWFLTDERFVNWRDNKAGDLLWVSAGPGCGKSVLSKSLIDERHLSPDTTITISSSTITVSESVICYFFFKEGGEGKMDGAHALCAILHQLFIHIPQLMTHALSSHRAHGQDLMQRTDELWRVLLDCVDSSPVPIVCLLDALDECEEKGRASLIKKLCDLYFDSKSSTPSRLKFLITSRPYETLKMSFDRLTASAAYLHFDGDDKSGQIGGEINLVIDAKVEYITGSFTAEDRNKISQRLKNMENRTYLWLHLTLDIIENNMSAYSRRLDMEEFLSKLPSTVSDAYEKILSRSQDDRKVEALLQIVLAAKRPLTLNEANYALTLALGDEASSHEKLQENLWPQDRFKTTPGNLCGFFISIHDSKLSFIHQTAREFLLDSKPSGTWKGRFNLSRSHGILSKACMSYLLMVDAQFKTTTELKEKYPLFSYAANSWFLHFQSQDARSTDTHRKLARKLCDGSAPQTRNWLNGFSPSRFSKESTDLRLACYFNLTAVVSDMMAHEHPDIDGRNELEIAIGRDNLEMMEALINSDTDSGVRITNRHLVRAASRQTPVIALLLDKRNDEVKIREDILMQAVKNYHNGAAIMSLLFSRRPREIIITEELLEQTIRYGSAETMLLLLSKRGSETEITQDIVLATARARSGTETISALLEQHGHKVKITGRLVIAAMSNASLGWTTVLFDKRGHDIKITKDIVKAAVSLAKDVQIAILFLDKRGSEIKITEDIVEAASENQQMGLEMVTLLLDKYGDEFKITQDVVKAITKKNSAGREILKLLLDRRGHEFKITEDILMAAVSCWNAVQKMALFLDERGHEFKITEDIVEAAAGNTMRASNLIPLLVDKRGYEFKITKGILKTASANEFLSEGVNALLQDRHRREMGIPEDSVAIA